LSLYLLPPPPRSTLFPYTTLFRSLSAALILLSAGEAQERASDDGPSAKVLSLEQLWNQAEVAQDTHSLNQLLSDTFIFVDVDGRDRKSTRLNSSHVAISYAVFCLK